MPSSPCRNCGAHLHGAYCHRCGQQHHDDLSLRDLARRALEETLDYDGRLLRTLRLLLLRPGLLTALYLHGRRARFVHPARIFMTASLVFFGAFVVTRPVRTAYMVEVSSVSRQARAQVTDAQLDARTQVYANALSVTLVLVLPLVVVLLRSLYAERPWIDHAVFALHFGAAFLIGFLAFMLVGVGLKLVLMEAEVGADVLARFDVNPPLYGVFTVGVLAFLYRSLRRVYAAGPWATAWRWAVLGGGSMVLLALAMVIAALYANGVG